MGLDFALVSDASMAYSTVAFVSGNYMRCFRTYEESICVADTDCTEKRLSRVLIGVRPSETKYRCSSLSLPGKGHRSRTEDQAPSRFLHFHPPVTRPPLNLYFDLFFVSPRHIMIYYDHNIHSTT